MSMDANWKYDPQDKAVMHVTGFQIMFEGEPESRYFSGSPHCMPPDMSNIELVKLIREGFDFYRKAYAEQYENAPRPILKLKAGPI